MGRQMGGDVGAEPDDREVAEADLSAPPEQHGEPYADDREDQHEREQERVADAVEVRQLRPHEADDEGAGGQPQTMVSDQSTGARRRRDPGDRHVFDGGARGLEHPADGAAAHEHDRHDDEEDGELGHRGVGGRGRDQLAHEAQQEAARQCEGK